MIAAHGLTQATTPASQESTFVAMSPAKTRTIVNAVATRPTAIERMWRGTFTSSASAATDIEYTLRMFVAIGPWITRSSTGIDNAPNVCAMITAGFAPVPVVAIDVPITPSHTTRQDRAEDAAKNRPPGAAGAGQEARVVGRVRQPADAPADADRGHDL